MCTVVQVCSKFRSIHIYSIPVHIKNQLVFGTILPLLLIKLIDSLFVFGPESKWDGVKSLFVSRLSYNTVPTNT